MVSKLKVEKEKVQKNEIKREKVVIDVDSTLASILPPIIKRYDEESGKNYSPNDVTDWQFEKTALHLSFSHFMELYRKVWENYTSIKPLFELETLRKISEHFEIIVASKHPKDTLPSLVKWLKENLQDINYKLVIYDSNGNADKTKHNAKFFIDDNPNLAEGNADLTDGKFLFLLRRPYTPKSLEKGGSNFIVVRDINEALRLLINYAENKLTLTQLKKLHRKEEHGS